MKLVVRIFAMSVVFAGVAAAAVTSAPKQMVMSHQATSSALPIPCCGPRMECPSGNVK
ncbi:MAG TPA: hypothetical protein VFU55_07495 [Terracidiphilus sp.]|nr:hypothetical protein [Terracidiphilus sp.]